MKRYLALLLFTCTAAVAHAQQLHYDIVNYTAPTGWKEEKDDGFISYSKIDGASWAQIAIYKSTASKGSIEKDAASEWQSLVLSRHSINGKEEKTKPASVNGWQVISRSAAWTFNGSNVSVILTTYSNNQVCVSVLCNATAKQYFNDYKKFTASLHFTGTVTEEGQPGVKNTSSQLAGIWGTNSNEYNSMQMTTGGYFKYQYRFNADGTYQYICKKFSTLVTYILFAYETGSWSVSGNRLTISPTKGKNEEWSKSPDHNIHKWGKLVKSSARKLETVTYTFALNYLSGMDKTYLELTAPTATERDGRGSNIPNSLQHFRYGPYPVNAPLINDLPPGW